MLSKLQQYNGKYIILSCLYIGHANKNSIHLPQDLWRKIYKVVVLLVYHDVFLIIFLIHETRHEIGIVVYYNRVIDISKILFTLVIKGLFEMRIPHQFT